MDSLTPYSWNRESGPEAGFAELFKNRWTILSSDNDSNKKQM